MLVGAATTRVQTLHEKATRPLRVPSLESHGGVHHGQLISLQQEDSAIQGLEDVKKIVRTEITRAPFAEQLQSMSQIR
ncbi:hypothetical protein PoB_001667200 [Plakobranchus ocellatus]|uniref:Uncharacterized protein n=1 Tax=Plakobranchus ocellatus TaxID=259542 RepID=A0AAV3Z4H4_9GAST|nr:hypothetical protein PoB_001667200 [Plakobranchus ocellatus]